MKKNLFSTIATLGIVLTLPIAPAHGAAGDLDEPYVALLTSVPEADREQIQNALRREDCQFISGSWLNKATQLHYRSDTLALRKFLEGLGNCPGVKVWIGFYRSGRDATFAPERSNWSVFHHGSDNIFSVKIRLDSDIDITKLEIPMLAGQRETPRAEQ